MFKNIIHKYLSQYGQEQIKYYINILVGVPRFGETWVAVGIRSLLGSAALPVLSKLWPAGQDPGPTPEEGHQLHSQGSSPNSNQAASGREGAAGRVEGMLWGPHEN